MMAIMTIIAVPLGWLRYSKIRYVRFVLTVRSTAEFTFCVCSLVFICGDHRCMYVNSAIIANRYVQFATLLTLGSFYYLANALILSVGWRFRWYVLNVHGGYTHPTWIEIRYVLFVAFLALGLLFGRRALTCVQRISVNICAWLCSVNRLQIRYATITYNFNALAVSLGNLALLTWLIKTVSVGSAVRASGRGNCAWGSRSPIVSVAINR